MAYITERPEEARVLYIHFLLSILVKNFPTKEVLMLEVVLQVLGFVAHVSKHITNKRRYLLVVQGV